MVKKLLLKIIAISPAGYLSSLRLGTIDTDAFLVNSARLCPLIDDQLSFNIQGNNLWPDSEYKKFIIDHPDWTCSNLKDGFWVEIGENSPSDILNAISNMANKPFNPNPYLSWAQRAAEPKCLRGEIFIEQGRIRISVAHKCSPKFSAEYDDHIARMAKQVNLGESLFDSAFFDYYADKPKELDLVLKHFFSHDKSTSPLLEKFKNLFVDFGYSWDQFKPILLHPGISSRYEALKGFLSRQNSQFNDINEMINSFSDYLGNVKVYRSVFQLDPSQKIDVMLSTSLYKKDVDNQKRILAGFFAPANYLGEYYRGSYFDSMETRVSGRMSYDSLLVSVSPYPEVAMNVGYYANIGSHKSDVLCLYTYEVPLLNVLEHSRENNVGVCFPHPQVSNLVIGEQEFPGIRAENFVFGSLPSPVAFSVVKPDSIGDKYRTVPVAPPK